MPHDPATHPAAAPLGALPRADAFAASAASRLLLIAMAAALMWLAVAWALAS
jgi:hypothetical protein